MAVVETQGVDLDALGVVADVEDFRLRVPKSSLIDVVALAQANGQRVVIDGLQGDDVRFSLIEQFVAPAMDTTENLPPQCSF